MSKFNKDFLICLAGVFILTAVFFGTTVHMVRKAGGAKAIMIEVVKEIKSVSREIDEASVCQ